MRSLVLALAACEFRSYHEPSLRCADLTKLGGAIVRSVGI
jgi:hypothetical protein